MKDDARTPAERTVLALLSSGEAMSWDELVARAGLEPARAGDAIERLIAEGIVRVVRRAAPPAAFALRAHAARDGSELASARPRLGSPHRAG